VQGYRHAALLGLWGLFWLVSTPVLAAYSTPLAHGPAVDARAAVVLDVTTGLVLHAANGTARLPMASLTKIMTALVALEQGQLQDEILIPPEATRISGNRVPLAPGAVYTLEELLFALLLTSANDAAQAIALHYGDSVAGFVRLMNVKAQALGLTDTHFTNPTGLDAPGHYSSALDMARLTAYALQHPVFRRLVGTLQVELPPRGDLPGRQLQNQNYLLATYPGALGVKIGYTSRAGFCLVGAAAQEGRQVVAVLLGSDFEHGYADLARLLTWGFVHFEARRLADTATPYVFGPVVGGTGALVAHPAGPLTVLLERGRNQTPAVEVVWYEPLEPPIERGQVVGRLEVHLDGRLVAVQPLLASAALAKVQTGPPPWLGSSLAGVLVALRCFRWWAQRRNRRLGQENPPTGAILREGRQREVP